MSAGIDYRRAVVRMEEPTGIGARGTLVVLPGRGESPLLYQRFGTRMAADGYRVRIVAEDAAADARSELSDADAEPRVLVGIDTGALRVLQLVRDGGAEVDALILVGLPGQRDRLPEGDEIAARVSCPTQQARLADPDLLVPNQLVPDRIPADLRNNTVETDLPILALHGVDDPVSALSEARDRYRLSRNAQLVAVAQGRHDVLNSVNHRSVAAAVVIFLESLKVAGDPPILGFEDHRQ